MFRKLFEWSKHAASANDQRTPARISFALTDTSWRHLCLREGLEFLSFATISMLGLPAVWLTCPPKTRSSITRLVSPPRSDEFFGYLVFGHKNRYGLPFWGCSLAVYLLSKP